MIKDERFDGQRRSCSSIDGDRWRWWNLWVFYGVILCVFWYDFLRLGTISCSSLLAISLLLSATTYATLITDLKLDRTISALRSTGYNLFGNAIATSDLRYQILSAAAYNSFTIFSPLNSALFFLDMASPAAAYIQILHYHVSPRRLTSVDLGISFHPDDEFNVHPLFDLPAFFPFFGH